jgi:hypothetical protein
MQLQMYGKIGSGFTTLVFVSGLPLRPVPGRGVFSLILSLPRYRYRYLKVEIRIIFSFLFNIGIGTGSGSGISFLYRGVGFC